MPRAQPPSICPLSAARLIAQSGRLHRMEQSQSPQMRSVCRPHTHFGNQDRADLPSNTALPRLRQDPLPTRARVFCSVCCHPTHTAPYLLPPDVCCSDSNTGAIRQCRLVETLGTSRMTTPFGSVSLQRLSVQISTASSGYVVALSSHNDRSTRGSSPNLRS
jgi:hypothetical protein